MFRSASIGRSGADKPPANAIALPPPKRGLTGEQWADIAYCLRVLTDCLAPKHSCRIKKDARHRWNGISTVSGHFAFSFDSRESIRLVVFT